MLKVYDDICPRCDGERVSIFNEKREGKKVTFRVRCLECNAIWDDWEECDEEEVV